MKLTVGYLSLALLLTGTAVHAQLYKWVGPDGKVTYSDMPPPKSISRVEQKNLAGDAADNANLPFELSEAVKNNPVTLYSGPKCVPCDDARSFLTGRGIPFREKTVSSNDDIAKLRQVGGDTQMPLLLIGRNKQSGFESGAWGTALSAAGYPETSKLPSTYRRPSAEAAAPAPKPAANNPAPGNNNAGALPATAAPGSNAPAGFRF